MKGVSLASLPQPIELLSEIRIRNRVRQLGQRIWQDYRKEVTRARPLVVVPVANGGVMFAMDLLRQIRPHNGRSDILPISQQLLQASSYGEATESSGRVKISGLIERGIADHHVLVVEDILDTGGTLVEMLQHLQDFKPASVCAVVLLRKDRERDSKILTDVRYIGFDIPDYFVVGYGLDYKHLYRHMRSICYFEKVPF